MNKRRFAAIVVAFGSRVQGPGQYLKLDYLPSAASNELQVAVIYTLWIPDGVKTLRGIIVNQHGAGTTASIEGSTAAYDLHWRARAKKWDCALWGSSYHVRNEKIDTSPALHHGMTSNDAILERELAQLGIDSINLMLAVPKGHPLAKSKSLRLRDLSTASFIWFPRRESPLYYDPLMHACFRGGLKSPHIVQEGVNEATILSLVSCGLGVAFVSSVTRWRCPESMVLVSVTDLKLPLPFAFTWRKDNSSPLLAKFVADARSLPEVEA